MYEKNPFGGSTQVSKQLARYTHRVAIGNSRPVILENSKVIVRYKDYADGHKQKTMTLNASEFLRRFVTHVLPRGFVKMRHYGLLANRFRGARLQASRRLLLVEAIAEAIRQIGAKPEKLNLPKERCCEQCGSRSLECVPLPKAKNTL